MKLKTSSILIVGAGGLGCPAMLYLTAAGVGTLGIVDDDVVSLSNLQRQVLYSTTQVGMHKVSAAVDHLSNLNPEVKLIPYVVKLT